MKYKLLTSTAMGAVLATSSYAYGEGVTLKFFGGLNFVDSEKHTGLIQTGLYSTGTTFLQTSGVSGAVDFEADTGYVFGGAVGYQWDNGLIVELEAAYRRNKLDITGGGVPHFTKNTASSRYTSAWTSMSATADGEGHVSAVSLMANAWYEFNLSNNAWKPYVGGGIGIAWLDMHASADTRIFYTATPTIAYSSGVVGIHGTESGFAWQLGAGIGYEFAPGKQITLDYRYFNGPEMSDVQIHELDNDIDYDYSAHNIMIGVRLGL